MELKDVLEQVPGLPRRLVYYLEARGYIQPDKVRKQRIARRDYSQRDLSTIQEVWRYYQRGYALQMAYQLATATQRAVTYLGVPVPVGGVVGVVGRLRECPQVVEVSAVHGAGVDLLIKTDTPDATEVYHTVVPLLVEMGITGLPRILFARERFLRRGAQSLAETRGAMLAYVLMRVPGKNVEEVMEQLKAIEAVREASTVYGETDIIARVETADQQELDALVMRRLHGIPAVESTRTFLVIQHLHWAR